jgi:alanyl-tRNA synthetase
MIRYPDKKPTCGVLMEKLFYTDSHIRNFQATVTASWQEGGRFAATLDRTAFYPEGGGQPSDTGTIGGVRVLDVQERDGDIIHYSESPLLTGVAVSGEISWDRRFSLMQQHSGEHVVSGIIRRLYGFDNVGFHIGADAVTVDFNGILSDADLAQVEKLANEAAYANLLVDTSCPDAEELAGMAYRSKTTLESDVRIVSIPGYDACACCGMHVARTGEIGIVKLLSGRRHKGGTRIEMLCGGRGLADYSAKHGQVSDISALLSAKPSTVTDAVRRLMDENDALKKELASMKEARLLERAEAVFQTESNRSGGGGKTKGLVLFEDGLSPESLRRFCLLLIGRFKEGILPAGVFHVWIVVFSGAGDSKCLYVAGSIPYAGMGERSPESAFDMRTLAKRLNLACNGRGGGSAGLVQGSVQATRLEIEAALALFGET